MERWGIGGLVLVVACGRFGFGESIDSGSRGDGDANGDGVGDAASDGTSATGDAPTPVCVTTPKFLALTTSWDTSCAIDENAHLWCWGNNANGQLGQGDTLAHLLPSQVAGTWSQVSVGNVYVCARKTDDTLWCWGGNDRGQLGQGDLTPRSSPAQVGSATWTWIGAAWGDAYGHTCGVQTGGTLWCWGANVYNELGFNGADKRTPTQVGAATTWARAAGGTNSGSAHSCATRVDGTLWCWGSNYDGRLGVGDTTDRTTPTQVGTAIDWATPNEGWTYAFALKTDQSLWYSGWGVNAITAMPTGGAWLDIAGGWQDAVGVRADGTLWLWSSPSSSVVAASGTTWVDAGNGWQFVCAIQSDGTLWCWGRNDIGQLGLGDTASHTTPTRVCTP